MQGGYTRKIGHHSIGLVKKEVSGSQWRVALHSTRPTTLSVKAACLRANGVHGGIVQPVKLPLALAGSTFLAPDGL
jgi:hypothetical protein